MRFSLSLLIFCLFLFSCQWSKKNQSIDHAGIKRTALPRNVKSEPVSLLQEKKDILCSSATIENLVLDKRDKFLHYEMRNMKYDFTAIDFLDDAVLFKSEGLHSLFHLQRNGNTNLISGTLYEMKESDCIDTGSSKTCSTNRIERLFWSPTLLELKNDQENKSLSITRYGIFPNDASYFLAQNGRNAMVLIDYGSKVRVLSGEIHRLNCHY